jgi:hypothetical protein
MAYRGSYRDWSQWHTSKLQQQANLFGGVDEDIRAAFLGLSKSQLQNFLFHYEKKHGLSARSYAEQAFPAWKTGSTRMSAQTTERLLQLLPPFLGASVKCDLIRKLRERHRQTSKHSLAVTTTNYRDAVFPVARDLIAKAYNANLPADIESRLAWLSDSDSAAAQSLLAGAEAAATLIMLSKIDEEFAMMHRLVSAAKNKQITHKIELPYGILILTVKKGDVVADAKQEPGLISISGRTGLPAVTSSDQLLKNAILNLTPEQLSEISMSATQEALNLQSESMRAEQRHVNAGRDVDNLIERTQRLQAIPDVAFSETSTINTASGTTTIKTSKDKSHTWIIVAVALGVLVLLLILKR